MVDTTPLQKIVAKQVDDDILAAVAQAHQHGQYGGRGLRNLGYGGHRPQW
jgi:hypothetical protein